MKIGARGEYGVLRKVLMYRPGEEVGMVTEKNKSDFLFREAVDWRIFKKQHDNFVSLLEDEGVEVILINDFLHGVSVKGYPNLTFSRDICSVTEKGALLCNMAREARRGEPGIYGSALERMGIPIYHRMKNFFEGGDFVYLSDNTLLLGWGPRTSFEGVCEVSEFLLDGIVEEIVAVQLPSTRVHLDGSMMILSPEKALIYKPSFQLPITILQKGERKESTLTEYLLQKGFIMLEVPEEESSSFGSNVVCLGKEKVVSYSWNKKVISTLEAEGFDVISLNGSELAKGGGGPHCMTCPLWRE